MVSKTAMLALVKAHDWRAAEAALRESPSLLGYRDERGRNWLHVCCGVDVRLAGRSAEASVETARMLLGQGLAVTAWAFAEGDWKATPLWYAIGRGRNLVLAEFLLEQGADPNYCLWAASFNNDLAAIRLLARYGADLDDRSAGDTPFLGAVAWSRFGPAEELLKLGASVDARDAKGATALHLMLRKASDKAHFAMLVRHGARGDIPDAGGLTAAQIMRRKKDPDFRRLADQLAKGQETAVPQD